MGMKIVTSVRVPMGETKRVTSSFVTLNLLDLIGMFDKCVNQSKAVPPMKAFILITQLSRKGIFQDLTGRFEGLQILNYSCLTPGLLLLRPSNTSSAVI